MIAQQQPARTRITFASQPALLDKLGKPTQECQTVAAARDGEGGSGANWNAREVQSSSQISTTSIQLFLTC